MATWVRPTSPPGHGAVRVALVVGLVVALVTLTVVVRDPAGSTSTDLQRIDDAVRLGCPGPGTTLSDTTGFALDSTVVATGTVTGTGPTQVTLQVQEWFRGPRLEQVEVTVDGRTVRHLATQGVDLVAGARLLVSGPGWQATDEAVPAAGCGRTRGYEPGAAEDWR